MDISQLKKFDLSPLEIEYYIKKAKHQESMVIITGEYSSGKSCFVNAFLGKKGFFQDDKNSECTPVLVDVVNSLENEIIVKYKDGKEKKVTLSKENIIKYTTYTKEYDEEILSISIPVESPYLPKGSHLIDTPGTNTIIKGHEEITNYMIKKAHIVLYTMNKVISEKDIRQIKEILKYTEDIFFIITHIDDDPNRSDEKINELVEAVELDLKRKLNLEKPMVFPVGSLKAFEDDRYIEVIRSCIDSYIKANNQKVIMARTKKQLNTIFEDKLIELTKEKDFYLENIDLEWDELESKITNSKKRLDKLSNDSKIQLNKLIEKTEIEKQSIENNILRTFKKEEELVLNKLLNSNSITNEMIEGELEASKLRIGKHIRSMLEERSKDVIKNEYEDINKDIKDITEGFKLDFIKELAAPTIEEFDDREYQLDIRQVLENQRQCEENLNAIAEDISLSEEERKEINNQIMVLKQSMSSVLGNLREVGVYQPRFEEKVLEGGGASGAKIGRVVGEIADIAMILYNPGTGALKAADAAKDGAKFISYVAKSTEKLSKGKIAADKTIKFLKETQKKTKKLTDKTKDTVDNIIDKRNKAIEILSDSEIAQESSPLEGISKVLDFLSIGFWGEKVGGLIGESIKPTEILEIEDSEYRSAWVEAKTKIDNELNSLKMEQIALESAYEEADSINKKIDAQRKLEIQNKRYEELIEEKERHLQREKKEDYKRQVVNYYTNEIGKIFLEEKEKAKETALLIFDSIIKGFLEKREEDLGQRLLDIEVKLNNLTSKKEELEKEISSKDKLIEELQEYPKWIEEWVS